MVCSWQAELVRCPDRRNLADRSTDRLQLQMKVLPLQKFHPISKPMLIFTGAEVWRVSR